MTWKDWMFYATCAFEIIIATALIIAKLILDEARMERYMDQASIEMLWISPLLTAMFWFYRARCQNAQVDNDVDDGIMLTVMSKTD